MEKIEKLLPVEEIHPRLFIRLLCIYIYKPDAVQSERNIMLLI